MRLTDLPRLLVGKRLFSSLPKILDQAPAHHCPNPPPMPLSSSGYKQRSITSAHYCQAVCSGFISAAGCQTADPVLYTVIFLTRQCEAGAVLLDHEAEKTSKARLRPSTIWTWQWVNQRSRNFRWKPSIWRKEAHCVCVHGRKALMFVTTGDKYVITPESVSCGRKEVQRRLGEMLSSPQAETAVCGRMRDSLSQCGQRCPNTV